MSLDEETLLKFKADALKAISFRLVYTEQDVDEPDTSSTICSFSPEMAHQIFSDNELIFGYENLRINLFYHHNSSKCLVTIKYKSKLTTMKVDDVSSLLNEWLPKNFVTDKEEYKRIVEKEKKDQMFGHVIHEFKRSVHVPFLGQDEPVECTYKITQIDTTDEMFQEYHERFETFIIWFIDAANFIDLKDPNWMIFYIYEEIIAPKSGEKVVTPIGFTAIYKFFSYPDSYRGRISQFFILPTHQRKGLGTVFYQAVYNKILKDIPEIIEITVEGPGESFQMMRDYCDSLSVYKDLVCTKDNLATKRGKSLFSYFAKHKINKKQGQRVSDILLYMKSMQNGDKEENSFKETIFQRLKHQKMNEIRLGKKARKCFEIVGEKNGESDDAELREEFNLYIREVAPVARKLFEAFKCSPEIGS